MTRKLYSILIKILLILSVIIPVSCGDIQFMGDVAGELKDQTTTEVTFYSNDDYSGNTIVKRFPIGTKIYISDFPGGKSDFIDEEIDNFTYDYVPVKWITNSGVETYTETVDGESRLVGIKVPQYPVSVACTEKKPGLVYVNVYYYDRYYVEESERYKLHSNVTRVVEAGTESSVFIQNIYPVYGYLWIRTNCSGTIGYRNKSFWVDQEINTSVKLTVSPGEGSFSSTTDDLIELQGTYDEPLPEYVDFSVVPPEGMTFSHWYITETYPTGNVVSTRNEFFTSYPGYNVDCKAIYKEDTGSGSGTGATTDDKDVVSFIKVNSSVSFEQALVSALNDSEINKIILEEDISYTQSCNDILQSVSQELIIAGNGKKITLTEAPVEVTKNVTFQDCVIDAQSLTVSAINLTSGTQLKLKDVTISASGYSIVTGEMCVLYVSGETSLGKILIDDGSSFTIDDTLSCTSGNTICGTIVFSDQVVNKFTSGANQCQFFYGDGLAKSSLFEVAPADTRTFVVTQDGMVILLTQATAG